MGNKTKTLLWQDTECENLEKFAIEFRLLTSD